MEDYSIVVIPDICDGGFTVEGRWDGAKAWAAEVKYITGQTIEDLEGEDGWWVYAVCEEELEMILSQLRRWKYRVPRRT